MSGEACVSPLGPGLQKEPALSYEQMGFISDILSLPQLGDVYLSGVCSPHKQLNLLRSFWHFQFGRRILFPGESPYLGYQLGDMSNIGEGSLWSQ